MSEETGEAYYLRQAAWWQQYAATRHKLFMEEWSKRGEAAQPERFMLRMVEHQSQCRMRYGTAQDYMDMAAQMREVRELTERVEHATEKVRELRAERDELVEKWTRSVMDGNRMIDQLIAADEEVGELQSKLRRMTTPVLSADGLKLVDRHCEWPAFKHAFNAVMKARVEGKGEGP